MQASQKKIAKEMQRMNEVGKIDGLVGAHNVGRIIDLKNQLNDKRREKDFGNKIEAMTKYYVKLLLFQIKNGPKEPYKSDSILVSKNIN